MDAHTRHNERRVRLEEAALDLFATKGYRHTTVSAICESARVSRRHFYEQFGDRESVLRDLYDTVQERTRDAVLEAIGTYTRAHASAPLDRRALIAAALTAYVAALVDDPRALRVAFVEVVGVSTEFEEHRLSSRREWAQLLQGAAAAAGAAPAAPWVYTGFIPTVNEFLMAWWQWAEGGTDPGDLVSVLTSVLTAMLTDDRGDGQHA